MSPKAIKNIKAMFALFIGILVIMQTHDNLEARFNSSLVIFFIGVAMALYGTFKLYIAYKLLRREQTKDDTKQEKA